MRSHGFTRTEDGRGRWWRNWRAHRWFSVGKPDAKQNPRWTFHVGAELVHGTTFGGLRLKVSTTGEETLDIAYGLGRLLQHYWSFDLERRGRHVNLWPRVRFTVEVGLTYVSWCFGRETHSWERYASWRERRRRNRLVWWRVGKRRSEVEAVEEADVIVPMTEAGYPARLTLQRETWRMMVGPYSLTRQSKRRLRFYLPLWREHTWSVDIRIPDGIPVPGNPDSDINFDPDWIFGTGASVSPHQAESGEWRQEAIRAAVEAANRHRVRYGRGVTDTGRRAHVG